MARTAARRLLAVVLAALIGGATVAPSPALAHGGLVVTAPVNGGVLDNPVEAVSLTFTEKPASFASFTITAPTGARVDSGWSNAEPVPLATPAREYQLVDGVWVPQLYPTGFPVKVTVAHWPAPGSYVLRYDTVASDGDQVKGEVTFSYTGAVTPAKPGWQAPADQPRAELPAAQPKQPSGGTSVWVWLVPALLIVAAGLSYLVIRPPAFASRRRARSDI